jgi:hypothetical protein
VAAVAVVEEPDRALDDDRCRDGVAVAPGRADPAGVRASAYDDVHHELLSRAAVLVDRRRGWVSASWRSSSRAVLR